MVYDFKCFARNFASDLTCRLSRRDELHIVLPSTEKDIITDTGSRILFKPVGDAVKTSTESYNFPNSTWVGQGHTLIHPIIVD